MLLSSTLVVVLLAVAQGWAFATFGACQFVHDVAHPTSGCPPGTLFVSQTNSRADFSAIQPAVESLPHDNSHRTILIDAGTYHESLNVSRKGPTTLLGATSTSRPLDFSSNLVTVFNTLFVNQSTQNPAVQDNTDSAVLIVAPNKFASWTGQGYFGSTPEPIPIEFGTEDFRAYNINFDNRAISPAVLPSRSGGIYRSEKLTLSLVHQADVLLARQVDKDTLELYSGSFTVWTGPTADSDKRYNLSSHLKDLDRETAKISDITDSKTVDIVEGYQKYVQNFVPGSVKSQEIVA